jgi:hypothetical protein
VLLAIKDRGVEVVDPWHHLYVLHFGDSRTPSEPEFRSIFEDALFGWISRKKLYARIARYGLE